MIVSRFTDQDLGVTVRGFDARRAQAGDARRIRDLLHAHRMVVLKDQTLAEEAFCDLAHAIGEPVPYLQKNYHHPRHPLIFVSSNIRKDGQQMGVARTGGYWHSDTAFLAEPVPITMLYPQVIPQASRRTTRFIDMQEVFEAMPAALQRRLEGLHFLHSGRWRYKVRPDDVGFDLHEIMSRIDAARPAVPHPAVITHPVSGARMLYASRGFTVGVQHLGTDEGRALLDEVLDFAEQPRFQLEFQWALGDIVLWDNRCFAHKAGRLAAAAVPDGAPEAPAEEETLVYRIILRDGHPLGAPSAPTH